MNKNVVVITAMKGLVDIDCKPYCTNTWQYWCDKNNVDLLILDEPLADTSIVKPTWQRWYVWDILENNKLDYERVALVDVDTMIRWDAPNFFSTEYSPNIFNACTDNDNVGWVNESIKGYQKMFQNEDGTDIKLDWEDYFNCGFIVMSKRIKKMLVDHIIKFEEENREELLHLQETLRKGTDQTPVNYLAQRHLGAFGGAHIMSKKFNLTHLNRKEILHGGSFVDLGYVWHFNGFDKQHRLPVMKDTWELIKSNYE